MIISASRRTDIPAFYSEWFLNRLREGFVLVKNPFNSRQISKVALNPADIECIVFWTKNSQPMLKQISELDALGYNYYFQYTVNAYDNNLEVNVPNFEKRINNFIDLSNLVRAGKVVWRYDPIMVTKKYDFEFHCERFEYLMQRFVGKTQKCVMSFLDLYKKCQRNLAGIELKIINDEQKIALAEKLLKIASKYGVTLTSCAESSSLKKIGIEPNKCIDDALICDLSGRKLSIKKDKNQRAECNCVESVDIGSYNSCLHGCGYCYANYSKKSVLNNVKNHDSKSPLLIGHVTDDCQIIDRKIIKYY